MQQLDNQWPRAADDDAALVLDLLPDLVSRWRLSDRRITYCNAAWADQYGIERVDALGRRLDDFMSPDELLGLRSQLPLLGPDRPVIVDEVARAARGSATKWLEWVDRYVVTASGPEVISVGRDVTDRHLAETALRESETRFRSLAQNASDIVWRIRSKPTIHFDYMSPSSERILGYPPSHFLADFQHILDISDEWTRTFISRAFRDGPSGERFDLRFRHADGSVVIGETTITVDDDKLQGVVRDVTELRRLQAVVVEQALSDPLTGVSNRRHFDEVLRTQLHRAARADRDLAVAFIDLDGFKRINDEYGHNAGDAVLRATATRLCEIASCDEMVARLGGDEFAVIFHPNEHESASLEAFVEVIATSLASPIAVSDDLLLICEASIGIGTSAVVGLEPTDLLRAADRAMYTAKRRRYSEGGFDRRSGRAPVSGA